MNTVFRLTAALTALAGLAACEPAQPTGPATGFEGGVPYGTYALVGFGKEAVPTRDARIRLQPNEVSGTGPCNNFVGTNAQKLPAIQMTTIKWTDVTCNKHKGFEQRFFQAVAQSQQAVWEGGVLKIIGPTYMTLERVEDESFYVPDNVAPPGMIAQ